MIELPAKLIYIYIYVYIYTYLDSFGIEAGQIPACAVSAGHVSTAESPTVSMGPSTIPTARVP